MPLGRQAIAVALLGAALTVPAVFRFGIWDPWEVEAADAARLVSEGQSPDSVDEEAGSPYLPARISALGFRAAGLSEWAGRLPLALLSILGPVAIFLAVARAWDARAGLWAAIVLSTMPLFSIGSVTMCGEGLLMTGRALALAGFIELGAVPEAKRQPWAGLAAALAGLAIGLGCRGVLLGVAVPVLGAGLAGLAVLPSKKWPAALFAAGLAATAAGIFLDVRADGWSLWSGGSPAHGKFLSFEVGIEHVAHATFPWVGLLPVAIAWIVRGADAPDDAENAADPAPRAAIAALVLATLVAGFAAHAWHASRFGETPFAEAAALAIAAGLFLRHLEVRGETAVGTSLVAIAVTLLVVRDAGLFPQTALQPLALQSAEVPEGFVVAHWYGIAAALFLVPLHLSLAQGSVSHDLGAPYRALRTLLASLGRLRIPILSALGILAIYLVVGASGAIRSVSHVGRIVHAALFALPFAVAGVVAVVQLADVGFGRLGSLRPWAVPAAGVAIGLFWLHAFLPVLSNQFSARETFETYRRLHRPGDLLAEYRVPGRSAAFYSRGRVEEIRGVQAGARLLDRRERAFVVLARKELAALDQAFRRESGRHLVVVDDRSRWLLLASNQPIRGERDKNPISRFVRSTPVRPEHPVHAEIEGGKLFFEGYDLEPDEVGAGEEVTITWHWRVAQRMVGSYKPFVHIDGQGQRLNGDHDPVDGLYPLRYWSDGDYVLDRQTLRVPVNYRPGAYTMFLGLFQGDDRYEVTDGPSDGENRIRAGILRVR